jgi:hypothetical protein
LTFEILTAVMTSIVDFSPEDGSSKFLEMLVATYKVKRRHNPGDNS